MTVIVTMAGSGSRFRRRGYDKPKHMISARGRSLFEWSMESMRAFFEQRFVFACLADHDSDWISSQAQSIGIHDHVVVKRESISQGQAETARDVLEIISIDDEVWICNIDTYISHGLKPSDMDGFDGCVHVFPSRHPSMSYVRFENEDRVIEVAEKRVISDWATVGVYGFASAGLYRVAYEQAYLIETANEVAGERYVSPLYQIMIEAGQQVVAPRLALTDVYVLGTPDEVIAFDPWAIPPCGA